MKLIFVGCVQIGLTVLSAAVSQGNHFELIVTLSPSKESPPSGYIDFGDVAEKASSSLLRVDSINAPVAIQAMKRAAPDFIVVCGWQELLSEEVLQIPSRGCIGFHSSLLPKYRGHAPVNWAIIMGEKETGVTMFYLDKDADSGDIISQKAFPIETLDSCATIYLKSAEAATIMLIDYLRLVKTGQERRVHNPSRSFPAYPRRRALDGLIDFHRPAIDVYNWVRALTKPYPGAFFYQDGRKIVAWKACIGLTDIPNSIVKKTNDFPISIIEWEYAD